MTHDAFEQLVREAIESLPQEFKDKLDNVDIVIANEPSDEQHRKMKLRDNIILFGLYEGVPQTKRGVNYTMALPDKITIFRESIESICSTEEQVREQIRRTVLHEIGHHFGMSDIDLRKLQY